MKKRNNNPQANKNEEEGSTSTEPNRAAEDVSPGISRRGSLVRKLPLLRKQDKGGDAQDIEVNIYERGAKISAPETPWDELDLSDTFFGALNNPPPAEATFWRKKRLFFLLGALLGAFIAWLFTEGNPLVSIDITDPFGSFDLPTLQALVGEFPSMNVSALLDPGREWLYSKSNNFEVGREAIARGERKKHSVIIVPGIISSGLESWSTTPEASPFFRKRIWASPYMLRALLTDKTRWITAMTLDPVTGLDSGGHKVRAAQGLDAASTFMPGYWIWQKIIENLAALDYDHDDMQLFSYDWRLSYYNLEVRDSYFSRLRAQIELNLAINGKKTVLVAHSMGSLVVLYFFKWVEAHTLNPNWVETHVEGFVSIAGTFLGVPKAMSCLMSGEMSDTVELNPAGVYLLERLFSRSERADLFRSWAGSASMILKGGNAVWGDGNTAPDDLPNSKAANIFSFKADPLGVGEPPRNLSMDEGMSFFLEHTPTTFQHMLSTNFSFGIERSAEELAKNDFDHRKWANPLEARLPNAPSMSIYCFYGVGKETERAYVYQEGPYERDEVTTAGDPVSQEAESCDTTPRNPLDFPLTRRSWIDGTASEGPNLRSGVLFGEGDGTVSLLSLGAMCAPGGGWKRELYNPGHSRIVTREIQHQPVAFDPRGGPGTADHVDILGSRELNSLLLSVVSGNGKRVKNQIYSNIAEYVQKIKWDAE